MNPVSYIMNLEIWRKQIRVDWASAEITSPIFRTPWNGLDFHGYHGKNDGTDTMPIEIPL